MAAPDFGVTILTGPTGVGKSDLAVELARQVKGVILSADSRQIYRQMDIGTATPPATMLSQVPHHFINELDPSVSYSAGQWARDALLLIRKYQQEQRPVLVCGGSGFYIEALIHPLYESAPVDPELRAALAAETRGMSNHELHEQLKQLDAETAGGVEEEDRKKILRYLEIARKERRKPSRLFATQERTSPLSYHLYVLNQERESLYQRINDRVDHMLANGLIDEVQSLLNAGYSPELNALNSPGYKEVIAFLQGSIDYDEMSRQIRQNSRRYAKRQLTWFRRWQGAIWYDRSEITTLTRKVLSAYEQ